MTRSDAFHAWGKVFEAVTGFVPKTHELIVAPSTGEAIVRVQGFPFPVLWDSSERVIVAWVRTEHVEQFMLAVPGSVRL